MRKEIVDHLTALADHQGGKITAEAVVLAATPQESLLHPLFEWDEAKAAHQHRLDQARALIRAVKVTVSSSTFTISAPFFVRDPSAAPEQGYVSLGKLKSDNDLAREVVIAEFSRASSALSRAKAVAAALGLSQEIEQLHGDLNALAERLQEQQGAPGA
jgi:hypothetical protein